MSRFTRTPSPSPEREYNSHSTSSSSGSSDTEHEAVREPGTSSGPPPSSRALSAPALPLGSRYDSIRIESVGEESESNSESENRDPVRSKFLEEKAVNQYAGTIGLDSSRVKGQSESVTSEEERRREEAEMETEKGTAALNFGISHRWEAWLPLVVFVLRAPPLPRVPERCGI
ncbi:UNVERIFIED_CONTAM: hypothetical protein FKN15_017965 [Acipenser sinensis]